MLEHISKNKIKTKLVLLFGVPGVGKGSFADLIHKNFNFYKSTPGDLIRHYVSDSRR